MATTATMTTNVLGGDRHRGGAAVIALTAAAVTAAGCPDEQGASSAVDPSARGPATEADDMSEKTRDKASRDTGSGDQPETGSPARAQAPSGAPPRAPTFSARAADLTDEDLERMIESGEIPPETEAIDLTSNELTARSIDLLSQAPLTRVTTLAISDNRLGAAGARAIAGAPLFSELRDLDVGYNDIGLAGVRALFSADNPMPRLRTLTLDGTELSGEGIELLVGSPIATSLRGLALRDTGLTDADAQALAEAESLSDLRSLRVGHNPITEAGVRVLRASPHLEGCTIRGP